MIQYIVYRENRTPGILIIRFLNVVNTFSICETAYLANVTLNSVSCVLHWSDNGTETQTRVFIRSPFYVEIGNAKSYYVQFNNNQECYIIEYSGVYNSHEYLYYSKHSKDQLLECGLVKENEFVPFKLFSENEIMIEYTYRIDNKNGKNEIDVNRKIEIYRGKYVNNPKEHFPRMIQEDITLNETSSCEASKEKNSQVQEVSGFTEREAVSNSTEGNPLTMIDNSKMLNQHEECERYNFTE